jgi:putative nucleotidyltransferase with HDIG domain
MIEPARRLAETHLAQALPRRWSHVQAVGARAVEVAPFVGSDEDGAVLVAAAWLHDIGYTPEAVDTGLHALDGARFLRSHGVDERVCALVAHHSAAMVEAELRGLADQLAAEFDREVSPVADALWFCDMTTGPDGQWVSVEERFTEIRARYGPGHVVTEFITRAAPVLSEAARRTQQRMAGTHPA